LAFHGSKGGSILFYEFTCLRINAKVNYYLFMVSVGYRNIVLLQTVAVEGNS